MSGGVVGSSADVDVESVGRFRVAKDVRLRWNRQRLRGIRDRKRLSGGQRMSAEKRRRRRSLSGRRRHWKPAIDKDEVQRPSVGEVT